MENKGSYSRNTDNKRNGHFFGWQSGRVLLLAAFLLIAGPGRLWAAIGATATPGVMSFNPAPVGIAEASAQQLTATFDVSGYTGSFTPTATLHYGYDYTAGAVDCTGGASPETCTVTITFQPTLPGARKDALLLMNGTTILTTVLLGGIGQAPLALVQPGVVTSPILSATYYIYNSTVDENGTVYLLSDNSSAVYSLTKAGVVTQLPITVTNFAPSSIAVDGAGTLYIAQNTYSHAIVTYTAGGVQGAITFQPPSPYVPCSNSNGGTLEYLIAAAVDDAGNLFADEILCDEIFELKADGTYATTPISPSITQPYQIAVDSTDDVFIGGYAINELTSGGTQTQINTVGASEGLAVDAAGTVYATRYTGGGVAELAASNYATELAGLDTSAAPLGVSLGSDGTLYVGNYNDLDKVDRSQGAIAFGEQFVETTSTAQNVGIYNGGNESLALSNIVLTGSAFAMSPTATNGCTDSTVLAPGSLCQIAVTMTAPHAGTFSGSITFTSNSLNTTSMENTVALSGYVYGPYVTPSPTSLAFGSQVTGTTSAPQTVTLTNQGDLYAAGLGTPAPPSSAFQVTLCTDYYSIAVGASCQASVTFSPTVVQAYSGTVTVPVSSGGGGSWPSVTFTVSGTGVAPTPVAGVSPLSLRFSNQGVGTTSGSQPVTLSNTGTAALTITNIAASANFGQTNNCGSSVAVSGSCTINVTFAPTGTGTLTGTLSITDNNNGVTGSMQTVLLSGTGINPILHWPGPIVLPPPPSHPVPGQPRLPPTVPPTVTPGGTGTEPVVRSPGPTVLPLPPPSLPVPGQPNAPVLPPQLPSLPAPGQPTHNASNSPQTATLSGTGTMPLVSVSSPSLTFSAQYVGTSGSAQTVRLINTGKASLAISSITASGDFSQTNTCAGGAAAGSFCTINVAFKPTTTGSRTGTLTITDNNDGVAGSTQTVTLSGTGEPVAHRPSPIVLPPRPPSIPILLQPKP